MQATANFADTIGSKTGSDEGLLARLTLERDAWMRAKKKTFKGAVEADFSIVFAIPAIMVNPYRSHI